MTTYNTGNPVPSVDVRDLYDNAENLDNFSNGSALQYADRLGVPRKSINGMLVEFESDQNERASQWDAFLIASGYQVLGPYAPGLVFTAYNQVFSYLGEFYSPGPSITFPYTTTGAGPGEIANFRSVGDAILRGDLANIASPNKGAAMVGRAAQVVDSIVALRALSKLSASKHALVTGYYAQGDSGGGLYWYDSTDTTSADNGGTIIVGADGGRWKGSTISTASFGCRAANTVADNSAKLILCIAAALNAGQPIIPVAASFAVDDVTYPIRDKTRVFFRGAQIAGLYRRASMLDNPVSNVRVFGQVDDDALMQFSGTNGPVVVMMGDSIAGYSVSGATPPNSMYGALVEEIQRRNPSATPAFYCRNIGGSVWANANGIGNAFPYWYTNPLTPWLDYIQALNPDLLFLAFGMNDSAGFDAASMHAAVNKIKLWAKVPSIIFVTTPQPSMATTYGGGTGFYDKAGQEGRDYVAGYTRAYATRYGHGLMDINRQFNLLRDGRDILSCPMGRQITQLGAYALAPTPCHEFYFSGGLAGVWPAGNVLRVNTGAGASDWVEVVISGTAMNITANTSGQPAYHVVNYTLPGGWAGSLSISVTALEIVVAIDGEGEITRFNCLRHGGEFTPLISWRNLPTQGPFSSYILSLGSPLQVQQTITDDMAYGVPNVGATENSPNGGNGVNHYSSDGVMRIVKPVVESLNLAQRNVSLFSGVIAPDPTGITVQKAIAAYREGQIVHMSGSCAVVGAVDKLIFTLPANFRPSAQILMTAAKLVGSTWSACILRVTATGEVRLYDVAGANSVEFNVSFVIA